MGDGVEVVQRAARGSGTVVLGTMSSDMDDMIDKLAELWVKAVEEDVGEPLRYTALTIHDVSYDEGTVSIDYDYDYG